MLQTYVIFVPTLGAAEKHVKGAMQFLRNENVHYYWDKDGLTMRRFANTLGMNVDLWDFWTIYAPGAVWRQEDPPRPDFWRHQLAVLPAESRLDVDEFIDRIKALQPQ